MKEGITSYLSFPRGQRMGLVIFMSLLLILVAGLTMMHYNNAPNVTEKVHTNCFPQDDTAVSDSAGAEE